MASIPNLRPRARPRSLAERVVLANALLVIAALLLATVATWRGFGFEEGERVQILAGSLAVAVLLLANLVALRRRLAPLAELTARVESADIAAAEPFDASPGSGFDEIDRLAAAFGTLLERIEQERRRAGLLVLQAQETERARVARDLHDEVNQGLAAIALRLAALRSDAPPALSAELAELGALAGDAQRELLALARQLRPAALDDLGLEAALAEHVRRFGAQAGLAAGFAAGGPVDELPEPSQVAIYRVAQEALANVARHAEASAVEVDLEARGAHAVLRVRDDGRGFGAGDPSAGLGLAGMVERARLAGGRLHVRSAAGDGTTVELRL